ncbi:MAG: hypothetical protein IJD75_07460, partial [Clostridia bacterium]|nr:hypothetical protein [Clostridia bacterium]
MKTNNHGTKQNIVRLVATLLIAVGVLTALPASAFAGWTYKVFNRKLDSANPVQGTQGDITVNYKFFGENMYYEAGDDVVTKYYAFDSTAQNNFYIGANDEGVASLELLTLSPIQFELTESQTLSDQKKTATEYCKVTSSWLHRLSGCSLSTSVPTTNFEITLPVVSSLSYTTKDEWVGVNIPAVPSYQGKASYAMQGTVTTVDSIALTNNYTSPLSHQGVIYSGPDPNDNTRTRTLTVFTVYTVADAKMSLTVDPGASSHTGGTAYKCTGTPTVTTLSGTYTIYVREVIGTPERTEDVGTVEEGATLYSVDGYRIGDTITAPSFPTLLAALPSNVQGRTKSIIGYYPEATADTTKAYKMPLTIGADVTPTVETVVEDEKEVTQKYVDIWVKLATTNEMISSTATNLNQSIGSNETTTLTGSSISNDFAYIPDYYEDSKGNTSGAIALTSPTVAGALDLAIAVNGSTVTNVNAYNGGTAGDANIASSSVSGS